MKTNRKNIQKTIKIQSTRTHRPASLLCCAGLESCCCSARSLDALTCRVPCQKSTCRSLAAIGHHPPQHIREVRPAMRRGATRVCTGCEGRSSSRSVDAYERAAGGLVTWATESSSRRWERRRGREGRAGGHTQRAAGADGRACVVAQACCATLPPLFTARSLASLSQPHGRTATNPTGTNPKARQERPRTNNPTRRRECECALEWPACLPPTHSPTSAGSDSTQPPLTVAAGRYRP